MGLRVTASLGVAVLLAGALGLGAVEASTVPPTPAPVVQIAHQQTDEFAQPVMVSAPNGDQDKDKGEGKSDDDDQGKRGQGGNNGVGTGSGTLPAPIATPPGKSSPNGQGLDNAATGHQIHGTDNVANPPGNSGEAPALGHCKDRGNGHLYRDDGSACEAPTSELCPDGSVKPADGQCPAGPPPPPAKCWDGSKPVDGNCPVVPEYCSDRVTLVSAGCPTTDEPKYCWDKVTLVSEGCPSVPGDPGSGPRTNGGNQPSIIAGVAAQRTVAGQQAPAALVARPEVVAVESAQLPKTGEPTMALLAGSALSLVLGQALRRFSREL